MRSVPKGHVLNGGCNILITHCTSFAVRYRNGISEKIKASYLKYLPKKIQAPRHYGGSGLDFDQSALAQMMGGDIVESQKEKAVVLRNYQIVSKAIKKPMALRPKKELVCSFISLRRILKNCKYCFPTIKVSKLSLLVQ